VGEQTALAGAGLCRNFDEYGFKRGFEGYGEGFGSVARREREGNKN